MEHYAEFMWHTPKTGYNESFLLHMLRLQLSQELGTALSYQATELTMMDKLVRLCQSLDNRQHSEQLHQWSWVTSLNTYRNTTGPTPHAFPSCPATPPAVSTTTGTLPGPMDTSAGKLRAKWVTLDVLSEWRAKGLCVWCGSRQHFTSQCVLLGTHRPQVALVEAQVLEDAEVEDVKSKNW